MHHTGVKAFIDEFREPFDSNAKSLKEAKKRIKDRGDSATAAAVKLEQLVVLSEYKKAQDRGTKLHKEIQNRKIKSKKCIVEGWKDDKKSKSSETYNNTLKNNTTYIEKKIVSDKYKLIGYADEVMVINNYINIEDAKTTKTIYRTSGIKTRTGYLVPPTFFYPPLDKLQDCNFNEAALQMSLYMYLLWINNKKMKPGKMFIRHIKTNAQDKITEEPLIEVPYLREEVKAMLKYRLKNAV